MIQRIWPLASILALALLLACGSTEEPQAAPAVAEEPQAVAFTGQPLFRPQLAAEVLARHQANLAKARADFEADPDRVEHAIWLGRRLAYLGEYRQAIAVYGEALAKHPEDARLYRHRGHRYISVRRLDEAVADLEKAASLIAGKPDLVEPDGLPNKLNLPRSSLHTNIWYHLGLARYLQRDWDGAAEAYRNCLAASANDDMLVAASHWLYMTLRRQGDEAAARALLEPIREEMDIVENADYHRLLLMYKGLAPPDALGDGAGGDLSSATVGYGVGNWRLYNGEAEAAAAVFKRVVAGETWAAFGYIAAERELARP